MRVPSLACIALFAFVIAGPAIGQPAKRALLIGIDDYTASTLPAVSGVAHRGWPDLRGGANDVRILTDMLVLRYGFARTDIVTLTNQQATRAAILRAIDGHLVRPARKGDVVFYYFAGHGAQVPNPASDEPDRRDESIVPADSRRGAPDIRDKELRPLFNRILERGAHLTLLLDHCHSGSGFRGGMPNGARPRGIAPAPPLRDGRNYGPRPDERGALILASTQDLDTAWETLGEDGLMHGAFTWAWIGAIRDAVSGEAAQETFLRAQARLRVDRADQAPAMLGNAQARLQPFLGTHRRRERLVIAVERVEDGEVILQGGWAHGLTIDTELSPIGDRLSRVRVTRLLGLGRSVARTSASTIRAGALLEVIRWAPPPERPLRVFAPRIAGNVRALAQRFAATTKARWIDDPLDATPTHILRPREHGWELFDRDGASIALASDDAAAAAVARLRASDALFVQLPAIDTIDGDTFGGTDGVIRVSDAQAADYLLVGRFDRTRVEYAWIRPHLRDSDRGASGLPPRTRWTSEPMQLRRDLVTLRRIHAWLSLTSPPGMPAPYRLALRDERTKQLVDGPMVLGRHVYSIVLRASQSSAEPLISRYFYVFVVDSDGNSRIVFPRTGSVENRFPIGEPAAEVLLGLPSAFRITPPFGVDTYFLLSTEEPLPNPAILEWDGVRARHALPATPWSIERITLESAAPARRRASAARAAPRRR